MATASAVKAVQAMQSSGPVRPNKPGGRRAGGGSGSAASPAHARPARCPPLECKPPQRRAPEKQVAFERPFPETARVAIIGGGLAGLVCAEQLAQQGIALTVFDTGEHGVGGRLATRSAADGSLPDAPPGLLFDHAVQFFTATDPWFSALAQQWEAAGVVHRWEGAVGVLAAGRFEPLPAGPPRYIAAGGMRALAQHLTALAAAVTHASSAGAVSGLVDVQRPQWVSSARYSPEEGGWRLVARGRDHGLYDAVVIAHNGKCANRLTAPMGAPQVHRQLRRLKLSANWSLMAAFEEPLGLEFEGAFVRGSEVLAWVGNNTAKLGLAAADGPECWTLISTQAYGRANKVPQEAIPPEAASRVTREMLAAFGGSLGLRLPRVTFSRVQMWGAALPQNSPNVPCVWDPASRVGVCGDWLLGSSLQAAAVSGRALAQQIGLMRGRRPAEAAELAVGLEAEFKPLAGEEMGQFPGSAPGSRGAVQAQQAQRPAARPRRRRAVAAA